MRRFLKKVLEKGREEKRGVVYGWYTGGIRAVYGWYTVVHGGYTGIYGDIRVYTGIYRYIRNTYLVLPI